MDYAEALILVCGTVICLFVFFCICWVLSEGILGYEDYDDDDYDDDD